MQSNVFYLRNARTTGHLSIQLFNHTDGQGVSVHNLHSQVHIRLEFDDSSFIKENLDNAILGYFESNSIACQLSSCCFTSSF